MAVHHNSCELELKLSLMIRLTKSLQAWGMPNFEAVLKEELEEIGRDLLPLQQGLATTSHVTESPHKVMIINVTDEADMLRVKAGIFYSGMVIGCSCADDPTPISEQSEYCEVQFAIDKKTAETTVVLLEAN